MFGPVSLVVIQRFSSPVVEYTIYYLSNGSAAIGAAASANHISRAAVHHTDTCLKHPIK